MKTHKFTIEKVHNFECGECLQSWEIRSWEYNKSVCCPNCGKRREVERSEEDI